jgi:TolA-binding protein
MTAKSRGIIVKSLGPITALAAIALIALPPSAAFAQRQSATPEQRIERLERQVEQVQRQVFPRGRPVDTAGIATEPAATQSSVTTLDQRLDALERQMSDLLRQSEENGHRLQTLEGDLSKVRTDQNQRIGALEQRVNEAAAAAPTVQPTVPEVAPARPTTTKPAATKPSTSKSTKPGTTKVEAAPATSTPTETAGAAPASDPGEDAYTEGFHLWEQGNYDQAISTLKAFAAAYPRHRRVSYANNLIGRALLSKGQARDAAAVFLTNYRGNPAGERAGDSLYYLGQATMQLGQPAQACRAYEEFDAIYGAKARADLRKQVTDAKAQAQCR